MKPHVRLNEFAREWWETADPQLRADFGPTVARLDEELVGFNVDHPAYIPAMNKWFPPTGPDVPSPRAVAPQPQARPAKPCGGCKRNKG